jgi:hypothetical protein
MVGPFAVPFDASLEGYAPPRRRRGLDLSQEQMSVGLAQPPLPTQQQAQQPRRSAGDVRREAIGYGLAEALSQPISVESGGWGEAIAEALAGGLRGRTAAYGRQSELEREAEARAQVLTQQETENQLQRELIQARTAQANQPETRVTPSGTFWREGGPEGYQVLGRDPNWQPPAALSQQWIPFSQAPPEVRSAYPTLNPDSTMYNAQTGEPRPVQGEAQRVRMGQQQRANLTRAVSALDAVGNIEASIADARRLAGGLSTGIVGQVTRGIGGTPAFNLQQAVNTVVANLGFEALQNMRDNSPTGGALGQVAVQELTMLQSIVDSLETAQSEEEFRRALDRADMYARRRGERNRRLIEAYNADLAASGGEQAPIADAVPDDPLGIRPPR